mgnify:CR=1 FL=1
MTRRLVLASVVTTGFVLGAGMPLDESAIGITLTVLGLATLTAIAVAGVGEWE